MLSCLLFSSLTACSNTAEPRVPQKAEFDCGSTHYERETDLGRIWYGIALRRLTVALVMTDNGNLDLAAGFRECMMTALRKSAELGHVDASYHLGLRLGLKRPLTPELQAEALAWLGKAAAGGHGKAKLQLAKWSKDWSR